MKVKRSKQTIIYVSIGLQDWWYFEGHLILQKVIDTIPRPLCYPSSSPFFLSSSPHQSFPLKAELLHEEYFRGNTPDNKVISWSMGKSMLSCMIGIAIQEGTIRSIDDKVTDYAPELVGSGYDGVILKDVLQMSSGVRFDENYGNFFSDIHAFGRSLALGSSINALAKKLPKQRPPATYNHYNSMDTQVLGIVLTNAISKVGFANLTQYLEEKVWSKGGFEDDLYWLLDNDTNQMEIAVGTMNARTRDYARFGWLYLNQGKSPVDGTPIVNSEWVRRSVTPDAPHLMPGKNSISDYEYGYGLQWWVLGKEDAPTEVAGDPLLPSPPSRLLSPPSLLLPSRLLSGLALILIPSGLLSGLALILILSRLLSGLALILLPSRLLSGLALILILS